jgi:GT2 family glycosyltransferase
MGSVHIVIVNWNAGRYLRECLKSIAPWRHPDLALERVTVVDNGSSDGSAEGLEDVALPLEVVRNRANRGFAAACNQGAAGSAADYLLFLNPDTRLFADTLPAVVGFMDGDAARGFGVCGVQVVDERGAPAISCARFPTLRIVVGKMTGLHRLAPRLFPGHHLTPAETRHSGPVDQVIGAFFFVRRDLFGRLGGFDERYFIYYEEVDFALRAREAGMGTFFLREWHVMHAENVSTEQVPASRLYHSLRSRSRYAAVHWPRRQAWLLVALTLSVELAARVGRAALRRRPGEIAQIGAAYRRFVADLVRL